MTQVQQIAPMRLQIGDKVRYIGPYDALDPEESYTINWLSSNGSVGLDYPGGTFNAAQFALVNSSALISRIPPAASSFWMVWRTNGGVPTKKHRTLEAAEVEATRLAECTPGVRFFVLEALSFFEREIRPITKGVMQAKPKEEHPQVKQGEQAKPSPCGCTFCESDDPLDLCPSKTGLEEAKCAAEELSRLMGEGGFHPARLSLATPAPYDFECTDAECGCHAYYASRPALDAGT